MKLYFVTTNPEKLKEAKIALAPYGYEVEGYEFEFIEPSEGNMEEIAKAKLAQINVAKNIPVFVDDSGIFFEAYKDFPGILTKRIFKRIGYKGIDKLLKQESRKAYFYGVIALRWQGITKVFHGITKGSIIQDIPKGLPEDLKFPFDPIFLPDNEDRTLGMMDTAEKIKYSYRKKALDEMGEWLKKGNI